MTVMLRLFSDSEHTDRMKKKSRHKKIRVAILYGGQSAEHEVSIVSAQNIYAALDKKKYAVSLIGITKEGRWYLQDDILALEDSGRVQRASRATNIALILSRQGPVIHSDTAVNCREFDVVFPVLHGPFGEDGTVQGLLKLAGIPFVGSGVLGSAVGMDKDVMKRLLREAHIPVARSLTVESHNRSRISFAKVKQALGMPVFVKPANLGSSVGISKARDKKEFEAALTKAFAFDTKVLIEEYIDGREIECGVLGNEHPEASIPGEVIPDTAKHDFYSYEAKYTDANGAALVIPAKLTKVEVKKVQALALQTFAVLGCEGMARVDFFLKKDGSLLVNEINTIPGFTAISMYPKLWEASGIPYGELIDRLIELAIERFKKESHLK